MKVLICDPISPKGIALLEQRPEFKVRVLEKRLSEAELVPLVSEVAALVVRSETKVTKTVIEGAPRLRVVGRAGVGTDNVDVETATQCGIVVMNTPGGNTVSTAELTFAMLMALALLLTALVMRPVGERVYSRAIVPYTSGQATATQAWAAGSKATRSSGWPWRAWCSAGS